MNWIDWLNWTPPTKDFYNAIMVITVIIGVCLAVWVEAKNDVRM